MHNKIKIYIFHPYSFIGGADTSISRLINNLDKDIYKIDHLDIWNSTAIVEHEAKISKVSEEQLFYLMQRGISIENSISLLISGFCKEVFNMLPMEFASEADKLLALKLEGTVG
jgi:hypothetical protein